MPPKSQRASAQHSAGQETSDHSDASEEMSDPELDIDEDEEEAILNFGCSQDYPSRSAGAHGGVTRPLRQCR